MRHLFVLGIALGFSTACTTSGGTTLSDDAGTRAATVEDAGDAGSCTLARDQCIGASRCCPPWVGFRVDFARNCKSAIPTALSCEAKPVPDNVKGCGAAEENSCVARRPDAGAEGGAEVYVTNVNFGVPLGFERCDAQLSAYPNCP
jgi:hypothetical protein